MKAVRLLILIVYLAFFALSAVASINLLRVPIADPLWYFHCPPGTYQLIDFSQFYQAGQLAISKYSHQIYDPEVQNQWACALVAPYVPAKIFYNQSVPFLYVLLIPFGLLPYNQAYIAWCLFTMALALLALFLLISRQGYLKGPARGLFLAGVLASIPSYLTIWHGQTTFLLTAAFALMALLLMQKRDLLAGLSLALTTFKPQYMLPFIALAWGMDRKRVLLALCLFEALLMAVAAAFIGPENIIGYPKVLAGAESTSRFIGVNPQYMASMRGLLSTFLPHKTAMVITTGLLLAALLPMALIARAVIRRTQLDQSGCRWLISITFVIALIVSPHTHYFDCLLLSIPAALTLPTVDLAALMCKRGSASGLSLWHRIWCCILLLYPPVSWLINFIPGGARELEGMIFLAINMALAVLAGLELTNIYRAARPA
jgi:hypothetical protein